MKQQVAFAMAMFQLFSIRTVLGRSLLIVVTKNSQNRVKTSCAGLIKLCAVLMPPNCGLFQIPPFRGRKTRPFTWRGV